MNAACDNTSQYILITPQDASNMEPGPFITVHRMADPDRATWTHPYSPDQYEQQVLMSINVNKQNLYKLLKIKASILLLLHGKITNTGHH